MEKYGGAGNRFRREAWAPSVNPNGNPYTGSMNWACDTSQTPNETKTATMHERIRFILTSLELVPTEIQRNQDPPEFNPSFTALFVTHVALGHAARHIPRVPPSVAAGQIGAR